MITDYYKENGAWKRNKNTSTSENPQNSGGTTLTPTPSSSTLQKIKVRYFSGRADKALASIVQSANNVGVFTNTTNYQYTGKKVTALGFITQQPGEIEIRLAENTTPLQSEVVTTITLKEGAGMQWYPVDIDVPANKWLAVKCNTGLFKYGASTTTTIGGNGFVTITNGFPVSPSGGGSTFLGMGIEVEETIDTSKPYAGKLFSVIGDSISTYKDYYITPGNSIFYNDQNNTRFGIESVNDTWWMKAINELGGLLNTNDAWSGSRVSGEGVGFAALRTNRIDANTDVCFIMLGINDLTGNVALGDLGAVGASHDRTTITGAYQQALEKMQGFYPHMEIVILTNLNRYVSGNEMTNGNGVTPRQLATRIKEIANLYGLKCIDISNEIGNNKFSTSALLPDSTHPNKLGMERIAKKIVSEMS